MYYVLDVTSKATTELALKYELKYLFRDMARRH